MSEATPTRPRSAGVRVLAGRRSRGALLALLVLVGWWVAVRPVGLGGATGYVLVSGESMRPGLATGDLVVTRRANDLGRGDVVAFRVPEGDPAAGRLAIHRIVGGSAASGWRVRGDNRGMVDPWRPRGSDVVGRAVLHVPGAGRVLAVVGQPALLALLAGAFAWSAVSARDRRREGASAF